MTDIEKETIDNSLEINMEKLLNPSLRLTLADLCIRKILVCLWNDNDILISVENSQFDEDISGSFDDFRKHWRESIEVKVKNKVSKLALPVPLKKKLLRLIRPIGSDFLRWKRFHEPFVYKSREYFDKPVLEQLQWTASGAIDYRKTAEELIRLEMFDLYDHYRLACLYCFEDKIRTLWEQLPEKSKLYFHGEHDVFRVRDLQMEYYWPYVLKGIESQLKFIDDTSFNQHAFECSAGKGNKTVNEYFFHKLTDEERDFAICSALNTVVYKYGDVTNWPDAQIQARMGDVMSYLLSLISPEKQKEYLKNHPCAILKCFHDWPWHEVFLDLADVVWTFLPEDNYDDLRFIIRNSGYYFPDLVQKFFMRSPSGFKKHFVYRECQFAQFFREFFHDEDSETIKTVVASLDLEDKMKLVSSYNFFKLLDIPLMANDLNVVETTLLEASFAKEDRVKLEEAYMAFLARNNVPNDSYKTQMWQSVFRFLDANEMNTPKKRRSEDETLPEAKKILQLRRKECGTRK